MLAVSTAEVVVSLTVATILFLFWLASLVLVVLDDISLGGKVGWFILLTVLAPISVPVYLFLRHRRHAQHSLTALDT
jgi:hypothetical protein